MLKHFLSHLISDHVFERSYSSDVTGRPTQHTLRLSANRLNRFLTVVYRIATTELIQMIPLSHINQVLSFRGRSIDQLRTSLVSALALFFAHGWCFVNIVINEPLINYSVLLLPKTGSQRNAISDRNVTIGQFLSKLDCGSFSVQPNLVGTVTQTTTVRDVAELARLTLPIAT